MRYEKYKSGRFWAIYDEHNELISICVYKRGAVEVIKLILKLKGFEDADVIKALINIETAYKTG